MNKKILSRFFIVLAALLVLTIPFQNCSGSKSSPGTTDSKLQANGDGYGGKAIYQSFATDGSCGTDGVKSEIQINENGQAVLTKDNCHDIEPRIVPVANQMEHNPDYLTYQDRLFQKKAPQMKLTTLLCRGSTFIDGPGATRNVMDGMIYLSGSANQTASVKVGQYDKTNGALIRSYVALNTPVTETDGTHEAFKVYTAYDDQGHRLFDLHLTFSQNNQRWQGFMNYVVLDDDGSFGENILVPQVICYEQ